MPLKICKQMQVNIKDSGGYGDKLQLDLCGICSIDFNTGKTKMGFTLLASFMISDPKGYQVVHSLLMER